jgi:hypothetical protein
MSLLWIIIPLLLIIEGENLMKKYREGISQAEEERNQDLWDEYDRDYAWDEYERGRVWDENE